MVALHPYWPVSPRGPTTTPLVPFGRIVLLFNVLSALSASSILLLSLSPLLSPPSSFLFLLFSCSILSPSSSCCCCCLACSLYSSLPPRHPLLPSRPNTTAGSFPFSPISDPSPPHLPRLFLLLLPLLTHSLPSPESLAYLILSQLCRQ